MPSARKRSRLFDALRIFGPALVLVIIGFWIAYQFVDPAPPSRFVIATGREDGAYFQFGQQLSKLLAEHRVTLEVRPTAGSVENLRLLTDADAGVDVAFVQGGTESEVKSADLVSLCSAYYEPLWLFHRADVPIEQLDELAGRRIAVGAEGSGTRIIALQLLAENEIAADSATLLPLSGADAADALLSGQADAAFFVSSPQADLMQRMLRADGIALCTFRRADAYTRRHRFLSAVTLPEGVIDLDADIPPHDTLLLAPTVNLVARTDLHPALVDLLLQAADGVFHGGGLFEQTGEFPAPKNLCFPLSPEADRFFKHGPPFLQRYLPFWAATLVDRLKVMIVPLIALLLPLIKFMPPIYRWRIRSRIYRWYRELETIELGHLSEATGEDLRARIDKVARLDAEVTRVSVPLSYHDELYNLRLHINLVRQHLEHARDRIRNDDLATTTP